MRTVCPQVAGIYTSNKEGFTHIRLPNTNPYELYAVDGFPCDCEGDDLPGHECATPFLASDFGDYVEPERASGIYKALKTLLKAGVVSFSGGVYEVVDGHYLLQVSTDDGLKEIDAIKWVEGDLVGGGEVLDDNNFCVSKWLDFDNLEEELGL